MQNLRRAAAITAALFAANGAASAAATVGSVAEKCFDKGALIYVDCPQATAPLPAAPPPTEATDVNRFYVGVHAGYAAADFGGAFAGFDIDALDVEGPLAGAQIGYERVAIPGLPESLLIGVEIDASYVWADDDLSGASGFFIPDVANRFSGGIDAELDWLASARLRIGYAFDDVTPYVTGGAALAGWSFDGSVPNVGVAASVDEITFGAVVGGGVEAAFGPDWALRAEGLFYLFDDEVDLSGQGLAGDAVTFADVLVGRLALVRRF